MRIVVDAMGSDNYPQPDVYGSILAAQEYGDTIILVGDESRIKSELKNYTVDSGRIEIHHAPEFITQDESASTAAKQKPNSSIHVGLRLVEQNEADAFVSAGNTGAVLAIATLSALKRIPGIKRPALCTILPLAKGHFTLIDFGANTDSRPEWLYQFAIMGDIYVRQALSIADPSIGLLSNGEEEGKGNQLIRDTHELLKSSSLNYIGNVEPKEALSGQVDIVLGDGFTINIFGKTIEAFGSALSNYIRTESRSTPFTMLGAGLMLPAFRRIRKTLDPMEVGGAPMLGVNGVVIIAHGRTDANGIKNAIRQARLAVKGRIVETIAEHVRKP